MPKPNFRARVFRSAVWMIDDGAVWKQSVWFALFGSVVAAIATAVSDMPYRGESFTLFDGGTSFTSVYRGSAWSELGPATVAGAVIGGLTGLVLYCCGIRPRGEAGNRVGRVVVAGLFGVALGLSPVLVMLGAALSGLRTGESWAIEPWSLLALYAVSAALAYCASVFSIRLALRASGDELTRSTTRCTALLLPIGAVAATASGVGMAWLHNFSTRPSTVAVVITVVAAVLSATFALARAWALHRRSTTEQRA